MQYMGGKTRIAKHIAAEIDKVRRPGQIVWDAFCGGLSVSRALLKNGPVLSTDACAPLIHLYRAVQNGWQPPTDVDEATYRTARALPDTDPMKAFCGFGCSFGGKWFGGYGRGAAHPKGLAGYAARGLARDVTGLRFGVLDFMAQRPRKLDIVIYLDPPYRGTTGYAATLAFDSALFDAHARAWAESGVPVFISEYDAPGSLVFERSSATKVNAGRSGAARQATERLFYLGPAKKNAPSAETDGAPSFTNQPTEEEQS